MTRSSLSWWKRALTVSLMAGSGALHATCTIATQAVAFDTYDVLSDEPTTGVGHVTVTCDTAASYQIGLGPGTGNYTQRLMTSGAHPLAYNLYTTTNHDVVWGDGTGATTQVGGQSAGTGTTVDATIFGLIPGHQNAYVGSYTDAIVVTLTF